MWKTAPKTLVKTSFIKCIRTSSIKVWSFLPLSNSRKNRKAMIKRSGETRRANRWMSPSMCLNLSLQLNRVLMCLLPPIRQLSQTRHQWCLPSRWPRTRNLLLTTSRRRCRKSKNKARPQKVPWRPKWPSALVNHHASSTVWRSYEAGCRERQWINERLNSASHFK